MDKSELGIYFQFFNEIGIIQQLSTTALEGQLPDGLLISHFGVINHLMRVVDGQTPLTIARAFQVPKTTMTHTLAGLEKHGFVETVPNPKDGRSKLVCTTEAGRKFRDQAIAAMEPIFADFAQQFPVERLQEALPLLIEVREVLDRARD